MLSAKAVAVAAVVAQTLRQPPFWVVLEVLEGIAPGFALPLAT